MMAAPAASYDVAIVGSGPVGKALAILLAQRQWRVGVFEKWPAPYPLPRAVHFDHEVARILQRTGVMHEIEKSPSRPSVRVAQRRGQTLLRLGRPDARLAASGWCESNMFCQPDLERLLDARVRSLADHRAAHGDEVTALEQNAAGRRQAHGRRRTPAVRARLRASAATAPTASCAARSALPSPISASPSTG